MNIVIANDHGAVELKLRLLAWLKDQGHLVTNLGVDSEERVDYPDMAEAAIDEYRKGGYGLGILLCGTGIGISIAANRHKGIRCALVHDAFTALMAKEHNDANFLAFGGRVDYPQAPEEILATFLSASFQGGRHEQRVAKLDTLT
ncbi:MAG: RpiB/LacA/LacB family sugar-phosphate isomerase [Spirochaetota bacterium]